MSLEKLVIRGALFVGAVLLLASPAFAGPSATTATSDHKKSMDQNLAGLATVCGCPFAVDVNWDNITPDPSKRQVADSIDAFVGAAQSYCSKDASHKQKFCHQFSSLVVVEDKSGAALDLENTKIIYRRNAQPVVVQSDFMAFFEKSSAHSG